MLRRTKIVSTLGPASESPEVLEQLILAGVNVVRLNFSHGSPEDHKHTHIPFGNGTAYRGQGNQLAELVFIGIGIERHRFSKGDF